jgi:hypothetical protein
MNARPFAILGVAALALAAACAAPLEDLDLQPREGGQLAEAVAQAKRGGSTGDAPEPKAALVARVAGRDVGAGDLLRSLLGRQPDMVREHLELLVSEQLADLEAQRLGLQLDYDAYDRRCDEVLAELEAGLPRGIELDAWIEGSLGLDPARFRQRLKGDVLRELVTERVVRSWTLTHEHARIRLITAAPGDGPAVAARLADGEPFAQVAREASLGPAPELGGLVPFLPRAEGAPLSALAFRAEIGAVEGPFELAPGSGDVLLMVESRSEPLPENWERLGPAVEASLAEQPVTDEEFLFWQVSLEELYDVELAPFYELVDEPLPRG